MNDLDLLLGNITSGNETVTRIENEIKNVIKKPFITDDANFTVPNGFGIFNEGGGECLGMVSDIFVPTQPKQLLTDLVDASILGNLDLNTLEHKVLKNGKKIMLTINVGEFQYINLRGKSDEMITKLNVMTGFDGQTKTTMFLSSLRMICTNGMKSWQTDTATGYKNINANVGKINLLMKGFGEVIEKEANYNDMLRYFTTKIVTKEEQQEYLNNVLGIKDKHDLTNAEKRKIDSLSQAMEIEIDFADRTAWALLNGVTRYTNHNLVQKDALDNFIYDGVGLKMNNKAQSLALEMFN